MTADTPSSSAADSAINSQDADHSGEIEYRHLPERVKRAIRHRQDAGEILIGRVQLAVVSLFGTLQLSDIG